MVGNISLDAEVDQREVLDGELVRLHASDKAETAALMDIVAELVQLRAQDRKWKVVA